MELVQCVYTVLLILTHSMAQGKQGIELAVTVSQFIFISSVIPSYYLAATDPMDTGYCFSATATKLMSTNCSQPATSVLFDGDTSADVSTLNDTNGVPGILSLDRFGSKAVTFDFTHTPRYEGIKRIELVVFNCKVFRTVREVIVLEAATPDGVHDLLQVMNVRDAISTCDSLVRICVSQRIMLPVLTLQFVLSQPRGRVHLAEVTFHVDGITCPPNDFITRPPPTTAVMEETTSKTCKIKIIIVQGHSEKAYYGSVLK